MKKSYDGREYEVSAVLTDWDCDCAGEVVVGELDDGQAEIKLGVSPNYRCGICHYVVVNGIEVYHEPWLEGLLVQEGEPWSDIFPTLREGLGWDEYKIALRELLGEDEFSELISDDCEELAESHKSEMIDALRDYIEQEKMTVHRGYNEYYITADKSLLPDYAEEIAVDEMIAELKWTDDPCGMPELDSSITALFEAPAEGDYKCVFAGGSSARLSIYSVQTASAYKAAQKVGRFESGDVVKVYDESGKLISKVEFSNSKNDYVKCDIRYRNEFIDPALLSE